MGTHIVQMTDPSFMTELRDRVWNDFDGNLTKRIKERKVMRRLSIHVRFASDCRIFCLIKRIENEREAQLVLKGAYNFYNRPQKFVPLHSRVLVSVQPVSFLI